MMNLTIDVDNGVESFPTYLSGGNRPLYFKARPSTVDINLSGLSAYEAREVMLRLQGMPGLPESEIEREERKLPPLDPNFARRLEIE